MPEVNPFLAELRTVNRELEDLLDSGGSEAVLNQKIADFDRLNRLSRDWAAERYATALAGLVEMLRETAARQADVIGRLKELARKTAAKAGVPVPPEAAPTPVPSPVAPAPAPTPAAPEPAVVSSAIDPDKRFASPDLLHPRIRGKVTALIADLANEIIPMKVFETFRTPERQQKLFNKGRVPVHDPSKIVTHAKPWESYHQYGLAVDMVIDHPDHGMWETGNATVDAWWSRYHALAERHGLEPLSFELPHVQLQGVKTSQLIAGDEPGAGDDSWTNNFVEAVNRWPGTRKPPLPSGDRPPLIEMIEHAGTASAGIDWTALPVVVESDWGNPLGGKLWKVTRNGVMLSEGVIERTPGDPMTSSAAIEFYADAIGEASQKFDVPPEIIVMTISTETAAARRDKFTGPTTFRWEAHVKLAETGDAALDGIKLGDYSAGPMQILSNTARWMNNISPQLRFKNETTLKWFTKEPASAPNELGLYDGRTNIMCGTCYLDHQRGVSSMNPILAAACYNAGSLRASGTSSWGIHAHGDHLDRAAKWFGDACAALAVFGR